MFIAIEGIDGAGKTTLTNQLVAALRAEGVDAIGTREPWTPMWREAVCAGDITASTADRAAHVHGLITPALEAGRVVITDRYYLSCAAYAIMMPSGREQVVATQQALFPAPDLWIWLDVDLATCGERLRARGEDPPMTRLHDVRHAFGVLWPRAPGQRLQLATRDPLPPALAAIRAILARGTDRERGSDDTCDLEAPCDDCSK